MRVQVNSNSLVEPRPWVLVLLVAHQTQTSLLGRALATGGGVATGAPREGVEPGGGFGQRPLAAALSNLLVVQYRCWGGERCWGWREMQGVERGAGGRGAGGER